jgi:hypothetical protein
MLRWRGPRQLAWKKRAWPPSRSGSETAALVLEAEDNPEQASVILGASDRLRESAGEARGGLRVIAEEVRHARNRLAAALGAERFALHEARGRALPREAAITFVLAGLTARGYDAGYP